MRAETFLLLGKPRIITIIVLWVICVIFHYFVYYMYGLDEPFMFLVAVFIIPVYFLLCLLYSMFYHDKKEIKEE